MGDMVCRKCVLTNVKDTRNAFMGDFSTNLKKRVSPTDFKKWWGKK